MKNSSTAVKVAEEEMDIAQRGGGVNGGKSL